MNLHVIPLMGLCCNDSSLCADGCHCYPGCRPSCGAGVLLFFLAIVCPPLAVVLSMRLRIKEESRGVCSCAFALTSTVLWILGVVPGIGYAMWFVFFTKDGMRDAFVTVRVFFTFLSIADFVEEQSEYA